MQPKQLAPPLGTGMLIQAPLPSWNIESRDLLLVMDGKGSTQCYRMVDEQVAFKAHPFGRWQSLAPAQLLQHLWVGTLVSDWIRRRSRFSPANAAASTLAQKRAKPAPALVLPQR
jgi:hypothetical protein